MTPPTGPLHEQGPASGLSDPSDLSVTWVPSSFEEPPAEEYPPVPEDEWAAPEDAHLAGAPVNPWEAELAAPPAELLAGLNPAQARAVSTLTGPVLIVAGPGSGKTRVLTHRIAALLHAGVWANRILAVTFTNKAAAELRDRIAALVGVEEARSMWVATFHSACVKILRMYHAAAGLPRAFTIVDADDAKKILSRCAAASGHLEGLSASETRSYLKDAAATISRAKNASRTPADLARSSSPTEREYAPVMAAYNERLLELGACDFDDLLLLTLDLLRTNPEVRHQLQRRWWHISVDEFQDTNAVQYEIVSILAGQHHNVCVVGDGDQSIYGFRGAQPSVLTAFSDTFANTEVVVLEENYRSTQNICAVSRAVIAANPAQHRSPLVTSNPAGDPVRLYSARDDRDEANWVVSQIKARGGPLSGHAVLVRTAALTRALEDRLKSQNLDYDVVGGLRFYDRAEIKDALAYLRLVLNPDDRLAFERAIATPRRGVGASTVAAIFAAADEDGVAAVDAAAARATGTGRGTAGLAAFVDALGEVAAAAAQGPVAAVSAVLEQTGLREAVRAADVKEKRTDYRREENLDELLEAARQFVEDPYSAGPDGATLATLSGWEQTVAWMESAALHSAADAESDDEDGTGPADRVQVMTIHSAKGKEFAHVYVVGLEENVLPHSRAMDEVGGIEEERRLMFVAVSRAQQTLDLSHCTMRVQFGKVTENAPSRFLTALPEEVQRVQGTVFQAQGRYQFGLRSSDSARGGDRFRSGTPATPRSAPGQPPRARRVAASGPRLEVTDVAAGVAVRHAMFGEGTIVEFDRATVTVDFPQVGRRRLALAVAPLELVA